MGGILSEDAAPTAFPTTGKAMILRVQCSHTSQVVDVSDCCGSRITSDWTASDLVKAIEQGTGVHRKCQTLMFGGREMTPKTTLQSIIGSQMSELPSRVTIFMIVNRDVFPQKLGPFAMVKAPYEATDFQIPELTEDIRAGFYWEMKTGILECYGLRARTSRISGQVSPLHPVDEDPVWRHAICVPNEAQDFAWSYPVANWERVESDAYAMDNWESAAAMEASGALKSFLTVGGFLFFDCTGRIVGASTPGRPDNEESSSLRFAEPQRWRPEWTRSLAEQGRFQRVTIREIVATGARMFCWLRPNEVIEDGDGQPLPQQPKVPHGGLVYLFREDTMTNNPKETALDRYFAVSFGNKGSDVEDTSLGSALPDSVLSNNGSPFRAFSLVESGATMEVAASHHIPMHLPCPEDGECADSDQDCDVPSELGGSSSSPYKKVSHFQVGEVISISSKRKLN